MITEKLHFLCSKCSNIHDSLKHGQLREFVVEISIKKLYNRKNENFSKQKEKIDNGILF